MKLPRTQYIFIDLENVCETDLSRIQGKPAKVFMILGAQKKNLPVSLFLFAQNHPGQLKIIQTLVQGRNALDLILSLEIGKILATDPDGYFHIVSKDTDFESIVCHLRSERRLISRHASLAEISALRTPQERLERIKSELADKKNPRPSTRKTLENKIKSDFNHPADPVIVESAIVAIVQSGILSFLETDKIEYHDAA